MLADCEGGYTFQRDATTFFDSPFAERLRPTTFAINLPLRNGNIQRAYYYELFAVANFVGLLPPSPGAARLRSAAPGEGGRRGNDILFGTVTLTV